MNLKYKALALDLDGTLLNSEKEVSEINREALIAYQQAGGRVIVATGRPEAGALHYCERLDMARYGGILLSYNSCRIINLTTNEAIRNLTLSPDLVHKAARVIREQDTENRMNIATYKGKELYCDSADNEFINIELNTSRLHLNLVSPTLEEIDFPVNKCLVGGDGDYLAKKEPLVLEELKADMDVYRSDPWFLELVPKGVDKIAGLRKIAEYLQISMEEMAACGDGFNDISMVKNAGFGVAMANAQDVVKAAADYVTLSNDEDGVADVVRKMIMV